MSGVFKRQMLWVLMGLLSFSASNAYAGPCQNYFGPERLGTLFRYSLESTLATPATYEKGALKPILQSQNWILAGRGRFLTLVHGSRVIENVLLPDGYQAVPSHLKSLGIFERSGVALFLIENNFGQKLLTVLSLKNPADQSYFSIYQETFKSRQKNLNGQLFEPRGFVDRSGLDNPLFLYLNTALNSWDVYRWPVLKNETEAAYSPFLASDLFTSKLERIESLPLLPLGKISGSYCLFFYNLHPRDPAKPIEVEVINLDTGGRFRFGEGLGLTQNEVDDRNFDVIPQPGGFDLITEAETLDPKLNRIRIVPIRDGVARAESKFLLPVGSPYRGALRNGGHWFDRQNAKNLKIWRLKPGESQVLESVEIDFTASEMQGFKLEGMLETIDSLYFPGPSGSLHRLPKSHIDRFF